MMNENSLQSENDLLRAENARLLNELESMYLRIEEQLLASKHERDIAYRELEQRNRQLQDRLIELEKTHAELKQAQQLLVRSERLVAMGEMAAAIVHELKNPLTALLGRLDLIALRNDVVDASDLFVLRRSGDYMHRLTDNVLRFARQHRAEIRTLNLNDLVQNMESFLKPLVRPANIEISLDAEPLNTMADSGQVEQVLMNLILNAVDATEKKGTIWLTTGTKTLQAAIAQAEHDQMPYRLAIVSEDANLLKPHVFVEVQDNGSGIKQDVMDHIFEAFFTTKETGTGLGLSIVRNIVGEWGGNVLLVSKPGHGASFQIFLPCASSS